MNSTCTPPALTQLYRRLLSTVNAKSSPEGRLWPRLWTQKYASAASIDGLLRWPQWLSFSAPIFATASLTDSHTHIRHSRPPQLKRRPELNSTIYELMDNPVLFDPVRTPRNKIVLCHGLYGFDVRGPSYFPKLQLHYWSKVLDILKGRVGADVVVTGVPGTGSIADRAKLMHDALSERVPGQSINFIAHSMGGLDCRHLISHIRPTEYTPTSLTTISTPHRGSSFMDWCAANIGIGEFQRPHEDIVPPYSLNQPLLSRAVTEQERETTRSILGLITSLPQSLTTMLLALIDSPAYANLTTHFLSNTFNPSTPDVRGVKYYSVGARARDDMSVFHPLWLPKTILDAAESRYAGRTPEWGSEFKGDGRVWWGHDGLVSIASSRWGEFLGVIEGVDHWELRGSTGPNPISSNPSSSSGTSPDSESANGWTEWAKSFTSWQDARAVERPADTQTEDGKQRAAATAALDWVVNAVSSSHAANPGGERDPARMERRKQDQGIPVFDLERFYVGLCKKLYDDGM